MNKICVYCGSSPGARSDYRAAAENLGKLLAQQKIGLVYGGSNVGIMGMLADSVLASGGHVTGVIPKFLVDKEVAHPTLSDLRIVDSMHERKMLMAELADGFIALPGGLGTLEEFFEVLVWSQLGLHRKPCGLLNVANYFAHLIRFLDHAVEERFLARAHRATVLVADRAETLLQKFTSYQPPVLEKWLDKE